MADANLGGASNFAADREFARRSAEIIPEVAVLARVNRQFLHCGIQYCSEHGVDQFIDIGAAYVPVAPTHELVHAHNPNATVVYVDNEPVAVQAIHDATSALDTVGVVLADLRDPAQVLHNPVTERLIDLTRPVALIMGLMLLFIPDEDRPGEILADYREHIAAGSYLIISHDTADGREQDMRRFAEHYSAAKQPLILRDHTELTQLARGFTLVPPGIVHMPLWRPDPSDPPFDQPERSCVYAMVLRVPE